MEKVFQGKTGYEFSNLLEIHVIELNKPLSGSGRMDEWIRLFNAQTEEDKMNRLVLSLIQAGRQDDIEKAAKDKKYRDQLYKEYGIDNYTENS